MAEEHRMMPLAHFNSRRMSNDCGKQPRPRRLAFTLVELLVVIGIIALLIAILLPVLGRARESARVIKCVSNLRTIAQASMQYSNDHKGHFLPSVIFKDVEVDPVDYWPHLLVYRKYIPRQNIRNNGSPIEFNSVLVCPSVAEFSTANSGIDGVRRAVSQVFEPPGSTGFGSPGLWCDWSYGINGTSYAFTSGDAINALYPCTSISYGTLKCSRLKKRNNAKKSAEIVFMFDGKEWNVWSSNFVTPPSSIIRTRIAGWRHGQWRANAPDASGRANVSFMDGHVVTVPREELPDEFAAANGYFTDAKPDKMNIGSAGHKGFPYPKWRLDQ
jgi:prepilin-type processing-associated H-X9-DG protein/prepilin-type N-terminal cleavage/methylation domain-containing protein